MSQLFPASHQFILAFLWSLTLLAAPALADESTPSISVTGEGSAELAPDMAIVNLVVTRVAVTAREALDANNQAMAKVLAAMRERGIAEKDLQTSNFSIQPRYAQLPRSASGERPAPRIDRYQVRNSLSVRVRDLARLGEIIDQSVTLGVNEGGSVQFTNADPSQALEQARVAAVKDAMSRAETLARAAGVEVGRILSLSDNSYIPRPVPMASGVAMMRSANAESVPMAAGENSYRVTVSLTRAIKQ